MTSQIKTIAFLSIASGALLSACSSSNAEGDDSGPFGPSPTDGQSSSAVHNGP